MGMGMEGGREDAWGSGRAQAGSTGGSRSLSSNLVL